MKLHLLMISSLLLMLPSATFAASSPASLPNIHYSLPPTQSDDAPASSPSSPPLETDDPGTPGTGGVEVNFIVDCDSVRNASSCRSGLDIAIGMGEKMQFRISKFVVREKSVDQPTFTGLSQTSMGVKYRFFDRNGLQIATFPSFQFNDATRHTQDDGTLAESEGSSLYLPIIVSKQLGKWTVVTNAGYQKNLAHSSADSVFTAVSVGHAVTKNLTGMAEVTATTAKDGTDAYVRVGAVQVLFPNDKSRIGKAVFFSAGKSIKAVDRQSHTFFRVGLQIALKPKTAAQ